MICAEDELGLGTGHDGIMILDDSIAGQKQQEVFKIEMTKYSKSDLHLIAPMR
jgi:phenylalanyl-tRNA synthetase beta chain